MFGLFKKAGLKKQTKTMAKQKQKQKGQWYGEIKL